MLCKNVSNEAVWRPVLMALFVLYQPQLMLEMRLSVNGSVCFVSGVLC